MLARRSALSSTLQSDSPLAKRLAETAFLVIDDSPFIRRMVREILHSFTIRLISDAADGYQGLVEARRQQPKVIILDWFMPGFSGPDFLRVLRHSSASPAPDADVVVITGRPTKTLVLEAQEFDVASIIRKPFAPKALLERLSSPGLRLNRPLSRPAAPVPPPRRLPRLSPHLFGDEVGAKARSPANPLDGFSLDDQTWAI